MFKISYDALHGRRSHYGVYRRALFDTVHIHPEYEYKRFKELLHLYMHELLYFKDVQPRNNVIFSHTTLPK